MLGSLLEGRVCVHARACVCVHGHTCAVRVFTASVLSLSRGALELGQAQSLGLQAHHLLRPSSLDVTFHLWM